MAGWLLWTVYGGVCIVLAIAVRRLRRQTRERRAITRAIDNMCDQYEQERTRATDAWLSRLAEYEGRR